MNDNIDRWLIEYTTHNAQNENAHRLNRSKEEIKKHLQEAIAEAFKEGRKFQLDRDERFLGTNLHYYTEQLRAVLNKEKQDL